MAWLRHGPLDDLVSGSRSTKFLQVLQEQVAVLRRGPTGRGILALVLIGLGAGHWWPRASSTEYIRRLETTSIPTPLGSDVRRLLLRRVVRPGCIREHRAPGRAPRLTRDPLRKMIVLNRATANERQRSADRCVRIEADRPSAVPERSRKDYGSWAQRPPCPHVRSTPKEELQWAPMKSKAKQCVRGCRLEGILLHHCPLVSASNVDQEIGWVKEEFKKIGVAYKYFAPRARTTWYPHYVPPR